MSENRDCGADAAAYVLGALEPPEAEAFRAHLATCVVCRDEISAFQEVADQLPLTTTVQPVPPGLKRRVMAEVHGDARKRVRSDPGQGRSRRRMRLPPWLFSAAPSPALAFGTAVLVLAVALAAIAIGTSGGGSTRVYDANVTWSGGAKLRVNNGRGELIVHGMPSPPASKVYEVWIQRGQRKPSPTSALFSVTSTGSGAVDVPGNLRGVSRVLVTPEPIGGSAAPTHAPVLVASIS